MDYRVLDYRTADVCDESVEPGLVDPCEMMSQRVKVPRVTRFNLGLGVVPGIFWLCVIMRKTLDPLVNRQNGIYPHVSDTPR